MGLETVEILLHVEDHFGITVPGEVASKCETVGDLQRVIVQLLVAKGRPRSAELEAEALRDIVMISAKVTGNDPITFRPESRWVGDVTKYG
ncbi:MAG: hypothetical protein KF724_00955 [Phycisphaeraceae bacterium]|nr:hypothetical protein [Phycisphaeraceae bacterium]